MPNPLQATIQTLQTKFPLQSFIVTKSQTNQGVHVYFADPVRHFHSRR
jgi:hypothetical protein